MTQLYLYNVFPYLIQETIQEFDILQITSVKKKKKSH